MPKLVDKIKNWQSRSLNIEQFKKINNNIAIIRSKGGLGDIIMHRMIFEDFKILNPNIHITFACPSQYIDAIKDHPYIDEVLDCKEINLNNYIVKYDTSTVCDHYERGIAPKSDLHRSDIWANHCGLQLTKHNMHIRLTEAEKQRGKELIESSRHTSGPVVIFAPISSTPTKNLNYDQQKCITDYLSEYCVLGLNKVPVKELQAPTISGVSIREWMSVINAADYVISVDTSTFHLAGGLGKPLLGIYTFACGKTYGKYFNFTLVQKHRDNGDWPCGPCYKYSECPLSKDKIKPCSSQISSKMLIEGLEKMLQPY